MRIVQKSATHRQSGLQTEVEFTRWVRQTVTGAAELRAFEDGQIDAVMDAGTSSAVLSPSARTALQDSNRVVREVLEALPIEACVLDAAGIVTATNRAWRNFIATHAGMGLGVREGGNFLAACGDVIATERVHATGVAKGFHRVLTGERQKYQREYVCSSPQSGRCTFTLAIAPFVADGVMQGLITRENVRVYKRADASRGPRGLEAHRSSATGRAGIANRLLGALPDKQYRRLCACLEPVQLSYGQLLYQPGDLIEHVYFPSDCPVSLLATVDGRQSLEVGLVGLDGMIGVPLALGGTTSSVRALVQGSGAAMRMRAEDFLREFARSPALQGAVFSFINALMVQVSQNAACNRFHIVEKRLARWLLMTRERVPYSRFHLTHQFLADMLGTRRESVTEAANLLKHRKLISSVHGYVTIIDRRGLEAASCSCYRRIRIAAPQNIQ
jgi:CRP-like cAMP-binding protein